MQRHEDVETHFIVKEDVNDDGSNQAGLMKDKAPNHVSRELDLLSAVDQGAFVFST